jgi:DNA-binding GntR family transcriptional regulator
MTMDWNIFKSKTSATGKTTEIADKIREGIASGELPPGTQIAGATALGRAYSCSGSPVEGARKKLAKEGVLVVRDGRYFVAGEVKPAPTEGADLVAAKAPLSQSLADAAFDELLKE